MGQKKFSELEVTNYNYVVPDSHFWTDLNCLINYLKSTKVSRKYLLTGLNNTIKNGYEIALVEELKPKDIIYTSINQIINFIDSEIYVERVLYLTLNYTVNAGYNLTKINNG